MSVRRIQSIFSKTVLSLRTKPTPLKSVLPACCSDLFDALLVIIYKRRMAMFIQHILVKIIIFNTKNPILVLGSFPYIRRCKYCLIYSFLKLTKIIWELCGRLKLRLNITYMYTGIIAYPLLEYAYILLENKHNNVIECC